jgi:plasmid stabilization system protein ParE
VKLIVSRAALADLVRLRTFLVDKNEIAAQRAVQVLDGAMKSLLELPDRGRPTGMSGAPDLIIPFGKSSYLIRYVHREENDEIVVLRMWHGRETRE